MKTLKEYADFLYKNGYKEIDAACLYLDGHLMRVDFSNGEFGLALGVEETEEFSKHLEALEEGTEYKVEYENYLVKDAFLQSPICNVANYFDGTTNGITLVREPNDYYRHTLELFEFCLGFQKINLVEHELFIMSHRLEQLKWAKDVLIPILEKHDYHVDYNTFFDINSDNRCNSNPRIDLTHENREQITLEIDCLTGKSIIWHSALTKTIDLSDKIYGKESDEVYSILLEEVWKKNEEKYGYIYNNDPHETVETYYQVGLLIESLNRKVKNDKINFNIIPHRYNDLVEEYMKMLGNK